MIRFLPDTWLEALVRPLALAVPRAGIYVEIIAPDFRFVFALMLALLLAAFAWRVRPGGGLGRALALLAFCALTFVPWLATTGNGRYFMLTLFLVGPLCVGLAHHLPVARGKRVAAAGIMLALQAGLLLEVEPWNSWGLAPWREAPAFHVDVPPDVRAQPATYVSLTGISYSLAAPQFHPQSRWINLSSQQGRQVDGPDVLRLRAVVEASPVLYAFFPSLQGQGVGPTATRLPDELADALDLSLGEFMLRLDRAGDCRWLHSRGLTSMGVRRGEIMSREPAKQRGFWLCPLAKLPSPQHFERPVPPPDVEAAMDRIEQQCPRFFRPGARSLVLPLGARRFYPDSDMRLYVLNDGRVLYKYTRALDAVDLGSKEEVVAPGFRMDCTNIRGRTGLPWEREI